MKKLVRWLKASRYKHVWMIRWEHLVDWYWRHHPQRYTCGRWAYSDDAGFGLSCMKRKGHRGRHNSGFNYWYGDYDINEQGPIIEAEVVEREGIGMAIDNVIRIGELNRGEDEAAREWAKRNHPSQGC